MNNAEARNTEGGRLLGVVVDKFIIEKKDLVLVVDIESPRASVEPGDTVEFRWPEGRVVQTQLDGVSLAGGKSEGTIGLHLPDEMKSLEVPRGAEVWKRP